jgi:SAM-dependent methyltransferase
MKRVLKPGGRLLIVDFGGASQHRHSLIAHMRMHQAFDLEEISPAVETAGFVGIKAGSLGFSDLRFLSAIAPGL